MCPQSYLSMKSKMQLLSQEEFAPLYLNALIRTRGYHITLLYHSPRSEPMLFIATLCVSAGLFVENGHLTVPNREPFYHFTMKASAMTSYSFNAKGFSESPNQRILGCPNTPCSLSPSAALWCHTLRALSHTLALTHVTSDWMPILQPIPTSSPSLKTQRLIADRFTNHLCSCFPHAIESHLFFPGKCFSNFLS